MNTINIGLLLPSSTILPISKDFERGINDGIKQQNTGSLLEVEITKAFIGQGSLNQTEDVCNRFFTYDDVDVVTGVISGKVAGEIAEKFNKRQKPLIVNNLGEYVPDFSKLGEQVFVNSLNLWQHAWAIGYYGVKEFGKKGMFIGSVYDAGYDFSKMFYLGMKAADEQSQWSFSVPPMPPAGGLSDLSVIFPFLEKYQPDFVFATFCGAETTLFINEFIKRGWHHKTKLMGLPFLLAPFEPLEEDITIYTTVPFEENPEIGAEKAFYHMGLSTGKAIIEAALKSESSSIGNAIQKLNQFSHTNTGNPAHLISDTVSKITLVKNSIRAQKEHIGAEFTPYFFDQNSSHTNPPLDEIRAGWYNAYLSI